MDELKELKERITKAGIDILKSEPSKPKEPLLEPVPLRPSDDLTEASRVKWEYYGKPILDIRKVPEGWTDEEPDLNPEDLDAHIERCHERLGENIMPLIFEDRLSYLLEERSNREKLMKKWPKLSYYSALRLEELLLTQDHINKIGDPNKLASTMKAIIFAYKSRTLEWKQGLVTYWSHGTQLCTPRPFSWEEFGQVNHKHNGWEAFWVEGLHGPGPLRKFYLHRTFWPAKYDSAQTEFRAHQQVHPSLIAVSVALRNPRLITREDAPYIADLPGFSTVPFEPQTMDVPQGGEQPPVDQTVTLYPHTDRAGRIEAQPGGFEPYPALTFWLDDDTGSDTMVLQQNDFDLLRDNVERSGQARPPPAPLLGTVRFNTADGAAVTNDIRALEVNMFDKRGNAMSPVWDWVECAVSTMELEPHSRPLRLLGPWLRHRFYTGTSPDGTGRLYVHDRLRGFARLKRVHMGESGLLRRHQYPPLELGADGQQMMRHAADGQFRTPSPQLAGEKREYQLPLRSKQAEDERQNRESEDAHDSRIASHIRETERRIDAVRASLLEAKQTRPEHSDIDGAIQEFSAAKQNLMVAKMALESRRFDRDYQKLKALEKDPGIIAPAGWEGPESASEGDDEILSSHSQSG
ncbi:hypothetical protein N7493_000576 [Penicillium malachiteum]|uniref:Uncharacterized protein n=1 Tax=Penicillium malachiteum TaxID=1324776 RepID=A0AAD6HWK1_9EURO|nr:hypothetical protein N7493_000576 [Penicillium malachiteum]